MSETVFPIAPGATLGVVGGGQLGRMFVHAAQCMGYTTVVLDPDPSSPAARLSHHAIAAAYDDTAALNRLSRLCQAITTEFENVPASTLELLAQRSVVSPRANAVALAQDRAREKALFQACGLRCAEHVLLNTTEDLTNVCATLLPGILKTTRMGYDGKGQISVNTPQELAAAWDTLHRVPCILEKRVAIAAECSIIIARGHDGLAVHLPVQVNVHRHGVLARTTVFDDLLPDHLVSQAQEAAHKIALALDYVGVLCVEFFILQDGSLIVNEIAPRPHNSGHYSVNACDVSQFELQVRTLTGQPLTAPRQHSPAIMLNLLGDLWQQGHQLREPEWSRVLALPGTHLHLYGKTDPRPGRKMGHLTITADNADQVLDIAAQVSHLLNLPHVD